MRRTLFVLALLLVFFTVFSEQIMIDNFYYESDLVALKPIFRQKVKVNAIRQDFEGDIFLNTADGRRIKFLGIGIGNPETALKLLEEHLLEKMVYLSFDRTVDDPEGYSKAYIWTDMVYDYYSVSVLWNAVLVINNLATPEDAVDHSFSGIFDSLEGQENPDIGRKIKDLNETETIEELPELPVGFEDLEWGTKREIVWYKINKQLVERRDNHLKYISEVFDEDCLLYFFFDDEGRLFKISYVFGFSNGENAIEVFNKFLNKLTKLFPEDTLRETNTLSNNEEKIEAFYKWRGKNASVELRLATISSNTHAMVIHFEGSKTE